MHHCCQLFVWPNLNPKGLFKGETLGGSDCIMINMVAFNGAFSRHFTLEIPHKGMMDFQKVWLAVLLPELKDDRQAWLATFNKVRVLKMDYRIPLSPINGSNSGGTFQCAQGMNQVFGYNCDAWETVKLLKVIIQWILHHR